MAVKERQAPPPSGADVFLSDRLVDGEGVDPFARLDREVSARDRRELLHRRAKGVISTSSDMERLATKGRPSSATTRPRHDDRVYLEFVQCPGLVVVAARARDELETALERLRADFLRSPREKAVVIIPKGSSLTVGPDVLRQFAFEGIAFIPSEVEDTHQGARVYAETYKTSHRESGEHLRRFMSSESDS